MRVSFKQDFLRNAYLIKQEDEPAFSQDVTIPTGARRVVAVTRRTDLTLEFYP
jgi:hypothetical protein